MLPNKKPTAYTAVVWLMLAKGCAGGGEETPRINKPFSDVAGKRVLVYLLSAFSLVLDDIDGLMTDAFGI